MPSSIFSSRQLRIVFGALLCAVTLVVIYHVLIASGIVRPSEPSSVAGLALAKMESYALSNAKRPRVALGSSMLKGILKSPGDDAGIFNLCLPGLSVADGLEALETDKRVPALVLVEVSSTLTLRPRHIAQDAMSADRLFLARFSPVFTMSYQPVPVMIQLVAPLEKQSSRWWQGSVPGEYAAHNYQRANREFDAGSRESLSENLTRLKSYVDRIALRAPRSCLFEYRWTRSYLLVRMRLQQRKKWKGFSRLKNTIGSRMRRRIGKRVTGCIS